MNNILMLECDGIEYAIETSYVKLVENADLYTNGHYDPHKHNIVINIDIGLYSWDYLHKMAQSVADANAVDMHILYEDYAIEITRGFIEGVFNAEDRHGKYIEMNLIYDYYRKTELPKSMIRRKKLHHLMNNIKKGIKKGTY